MPLISVRNDIAAREKDSTSIIDSLERLEKITGNVTLCAILKSSLILVLYNAVESAMYCTLEICHEKTKIKSLSSLTKQQRKILRRVYFENVSIKKQTKHIELLIRGDLKYPTFEEYMDFDKLFSGNLDARKIDEIFIKYGIRHRIQEKFRRSFLYVKSTRNKLAHGDRAFSSACRMMTVSELRRLSNDIFSALTLLFHDVEVHLGH